MYILTLETTGRYGSAAVITDGDDRFAVSCRSSSGEMNHLVDIISLTDQALSDAGITIKDIGAVAASIGPGSFTGIRIGVSTARAFSQALNIPCIPVRTLRGMAELTDGQGYVCTSINARRSQTYAALWNRRSDGTVTEILPQQQYMIDDLMNKIVTRCGRGEKVTFVGDGLDAYGDVIKKACDESGLLFAETDEEHRYQNAAAAARVAAAYAADGDRLLSYEELIPDYMRKAEAETRLEQGTLSRKIANAGKPVFTRDKKNDRH